MLALTHQAADSRWGPLSMPDLNVCAPIDANGNLISDGTRTFEWDARNQLVAVNVRTHRSEFAYDGRRRLVSVIEKEAGVVQTDVVALWCEAAICEERQTAVPTAIRQIFTQGQQMTGNARFWVADHLNTVTAVTDMSSAVRDRISFDPWGRRSGGFQETASRGYTAHVWHPPSDLHLSLFRPYDAGIGRWLTEDPAGLSDGPNLYAYVGNSVIGVADPLGLSSVLGGLYRFTNWMRDPEGKDVDWPSLVDCAVFCVPSVLFDHIVAPGVGAAASALPWQARKVVGKFVVKRAVPVLAALNIPTHLMCTYFVTGRNVTTANSAEGAPR